MLDVALLVPEFAKDFNLTVQELFGWLLEQMHSLKGIARAEP